MNMKKKLAPTNLIKCIRRSLNQLINEEYMPSRSAY